MGAGAAVGAGGSPGTATSGLGAAVEPGVGTTSAAETAEAAGSGMPGVTGDWSAGRAAGSDGTLPVEETNSDGVGETSGVEASTSIGAPTEKSGASDVAPAPSEMKSPESPTDLDGCLWDPPITGTFRPTFAGSRTGAMSPAGCSLPGMAPFLRMYANTWSRSSSLMVARALRSRTPASSQRSMRTLLSSPRSLARAKIRIFKTQTP